MKEPEGFGATVLARVNGKLGFLVNTGWKTWLFRQDQTISIFDLSWRDVEPLELISEGVALRWSTSLQDLEEDQKKLELRQS